MNAVRQIAVWSTCTLSRAYDLLCDVARDERRPAVWRMLAIVWGEVVFKLHRIAFETAARIPRKA